ncbi:MAG: NAD(P)-dependent oxidoreductase [Halorientalis sp.]
MCILVVGAGGLLGSNVVLAARDRGHRVVGTYRSSKPSLDAELVELTLPDADRFETLLTEHDPTAVLNCAAMTDVDQCETTPKQAHAVNAVAPGQLASACARSDTPFLHVSTDYVFDGESSTRYSESATPNPIQRYGATKRDGERRVKAAHDDALLIRPSFIYGIHRETDTLTGFPAWVHSELQAGESVTLFDDQRVTPSRARTTAECMLDLLADNASGRFHVAAPTCVTPYEFGERIRTRLGVPSERVERGRLADVDRPAARPEQTCLDVSKVTDRLDESLPSLDTELDVIVSAV